MFVVGMMYALYCTCPFSTTTGHQSNVPIDVSLRESVCYGDNALEFRTWLIDSSGLPFPGAVEVRLHGCCGDKCYRSVIPCITHNNGKLFERGRQRGPLAMLSDF